MPSISIPHTQFAFILVPKLVVENGFANNMLMQMWDLDKKDKHGGHVITMHPGEELQIFEMPTFGPNLAVSFKLPCMSSHFSFF